MTNHIGHATNIKANHRCATTHGLQNDVDAAYRVVRKIRTGTMGQSGPLADFSIGFGGFKQSGLAVKVGRKVCALILKRRPFCFPESQRLCKCGICCGDEHKRRLTIILVKFNKYY